jgi:hypothetical protein
VPDGIGEILQLAYDVVAFSARAAQIDRNVDWMNENELRHAGESQGPALHRRWDAPAWAEGRPDTVLPRPSANVTEQWLAELADRGSRNRGVPLDRIPSPVGGLDRDAGAETALARWPSRNGNVQISWRSKVPGNRCASPSRRRRPISYSDVSSVPAQPGRASPGKPRQE